ncbi:MAG: hypothetical protein MUF49_23290 [Oculatellaceae cyanobacterium Prado106]|nr:hypothetical protein [Oculatellaceae cyanobacterium Prado106]
MMLPTEISQDRFLLLALCDLTLCDRPRATSVKATAWRKVGRASSIPLQNHPGSGSFYR